MFGEPILSKHYSAKQKARDAAKFAEMAASMDSGSAVIHYTEEGELIDSVEKLMLRSGATSVVQTYGRLYTLQIVRWLACLISDLSFIGAGKKGIEPLFWVR